MLEMLIVMLRTSRVFQAVVGAILLAGAAAFAVSLYNARTAAPSPSQGLINSVMPSLAQNVQNVLPPDTNNQVNNAVHQAQPYVDQARTTADDVLDKGKALAQDAKRQWEISKDISTNGQVPAGSANSGSNGSNPAPPP